MTSAFELDAVFRQRGLLPVGGVSFRGLILPQTREDYDYLSFMLNGPSRKLVRAVTRLHSAGETLTVGRLAETLCVSTEVAASRLRKLCDWGILREVRCSGDPTFDALYLGSEFGPTLEWIVAQWLRTEARGMADWSVRLEGTPRGGDYDVLAQVGDRFFFFECKSGPPERFTLNDFTEFFSRLIFVSPAFGAVVFDTEKSLDPLIARLAPEWRRLVEEHSEPQSQTLLEAMKQRDTSGVWECRTDWFAFVNAKPGLRQNLRTVLKVAAGISPYPEGMTFGRLGGRQNYSWVAGVGRAQGS